jgi:hypothetical protein
MFEFTACQEARIFICKECAKQFTSDSHLTQHWNSRHSKANHFPCLDGCRRWFASKKARFHHHNAFHRTQADTILKKKAHSTSQGPSAPLAAVENQEGIP